MYFMLETAATTGALVSSIVPFALVIVLMYFMIIRPQKKKDKENYKFVLFLKNSLKKEKFVLYLISIIYGPLVKWLNT